MDEIKITFGDLLSMVEIVCEHGDFETIDRLKDYLSENEDEGFIMEVLEAED